MENFLLFVLLVFAMALPADAADVTEEVVDGIVSDADSAQSVDPVDSLDSTAASEAALAAEEGSQDIDVLAVSGGLAGGYFFTADCALGSDLMFYVPLEWAHDVFTLDSSGAPVNLSNSTCYAYCPDYPDYTFSCSRFGTFTYRATNYNTTELRITNISDTNMTFLEGDGVGMSDQEISLFTSALVFVVAAILIFKRG